MTRFFLSEGADVNLRCQNGDTPLHLTLRKFVLDLDETSPSQPSDFVRVQDAWSDGRWKIESLKDMIEDSEDEDAAEIYHTVTKARIEVIDILLGHPNIEVGLKNIIGETPMHLLPFGKEHSMTLFSKLANKSPQMTVLNDKGQTPLHIACLKGDQEIANHLLHLEPSSASTLDSQGLSTLHYAIRSENIQIITILLSHFAKQGWSTCTQEHRRSLLHFYLERPLCYPRMVNVLLDYGESANFINKEGDSPLSIYLKSYHLENKRAICQLLIEHGAHPLWTNSLGETLAHVRMHSSVEDGQVLQVLQDFNLNILAKDHSNKSILHHAAIYGTVSQRLVASLPNHSVRSLCEPDYDGLTPLMYAKKKCASEAEVEDEFLNDQKWQTSLDLLRKMEADLVE
ncbi:hypothetical protein N7510_010105 [Penicillium lagena]|uniref:uncharacterized protein n=1 Tax=Penicillium lagena TaxID=94218 RepID=UPI00253F67BB|nr:uncharacterized protein N7510_010105 [Penicillium lagena]KAJ5604951.1 hypothetical protein N7510_010105 [Penicillium lagena]